MPLIGRWDVSISTPMGKQQVVYEFRLDGETLSGTARQGQDTTELLDLQFSGTQASWSQHVTRPMKLKLRFEVTIDGDTLSGAAKAGALPASKVAGVRAPADAANSANSANRADHV